MAKKQTNNAVGMLDTKMSVNSDGSVGRPAPAPKMPVNTKQPASQGSDDDTDDDDGFVPRYSPGHPMYDQYMKSQGQGGDDDDGDDDDQDDDQNDPSKKEPGKEKGKDKQDKDRYQYWQSQATKLQEMNERLLEMLEKGQGNGGNTPPAPVKTPQQELQELDSQLSSLKAPTKPVRPTRYNVQDAYSDPDSEAFAYRVKMDEYRDAMDEYNEQRFNLTNQRYELKTKTLAEPLQRMAQERQLSAQQQKIVDNLKKDYKFTGEEAVEFIEQMSKPESMSMDNLVKLYRLNKGVANPTNRSKPNEDNRFPKRNAAPPIPNGGGANGGDDDDSDDDLAIANGFSNGLISFTKPKR